MPAAADFRLYHSNSLDVLAGLLAQELRAPVPAQSLLAPDLVLVPQVAMRRWLQATLAGAHGIAANLEFLTPGEFVQRALDANVPGAGEDLDPEALRWRLYASLSEPATMREPALQPLRAYLDADGDALKPWSLAGELAAVFEKYQAWRRDWLLGWEAGQARLDPQAALWRRVAGGRAHRARRIDDFLRRFAAGAEGDGPVLPAGLPPRLFAFATLNVSPDVLRVIASQARVGTLHFYLPTPTRKYWGDLGTLAERLRSGGDDAFATDDDNPLLQAWGVAGRDFMAVLGGYEVVHPSGEIAAYADPESRPDDEPARDSLLQRLQRDLLHRRPPARWREAVDRHDPSLQVHACHTRLREVQVLHDRLRSLLEPDSPEGRRFDPPLEPREIAVLAPDIDPYAPYIQAVFGSLAGRPEFIPYALADASPLVAEPLAEVFLRLLALPVSRFGASEVLDLLATPAIAEHAGLDAAALDRLRYWLQAAGARWGLDAAHRVRHDAPADNTYTWAFALDRLLLGHASGDDGDIAGVAPWTGLEGSALHALDALIRLLRVLARHERAFAAAMTPSQWRERVLGLLDALLPPTPRDPADQRTLERLRASLDDFATSAARAGFEAPVPPEVVRAHFQRVLAEADSRAPLLTGGVSFGRMVPMRLLPFRVICLLGMNDGDYPRRDPAAGLNQLTAELGTAKRRRGDRSLRDDDRFLFLQLFAAASDVFYVSYLGADPRDGSRREPSLLVTELLEVSARYHRDAGVEATREALVLRHPLQPFAPVAFGSPDTDDGRESDPRRYSYRGEWHAAADAGGGTRRGLGRWIDSPLPATPTQERVSLAQLRAFLRDPSDAFLRQRLAMRLPEAADAIDDCDPLAPPARGLQRWQLQQAVFDGCVRGLHDDALQARLCAEALLPSGPLGARTLAGLLAEVRPYADAFVQWRGNEQPQAETFELELDGVCLHGRIEQIYPHGLPRFRYDRLHGPAQITHGLDWLVLGALGRDSMLAQFCDSGAGPGPLLREPADPAAARAALTALLRLRAWGLREPLPFGPRAGWLWYDGQQRLDEGEVPRSNGKSPWQRAQEQWRSDTGFSEGDSAGVSLALRGRDPFGDGPDERGLGEEFRRIAAIVFDAVVRGRDAEATA